MIDELPSVRLPDGFTRLCCMNIRNSRKDYGVIADIIRNDKFLEILLTEAFREQVTALGIEGLIDSFGWTSLRDRIAEAYLFRAKHGQFPTEIEINQVKEVSDIVNRFEFISTDGCHRVFLLAFFLKLADIAMEEEYMFVGHDYVHIAEEVDEILKLGVAKSSQPDWLILIVWALNTILGHAKATDIIKSSKGNFAKILPELSGEDHEKFMLCLVKYGNAINDNSFFLYEKI